MSKAAEDFLKDWDPEFAKDWDGGKHPRADIGKFGVGKLKDGRVNIQPAAATKPGVSGEAAGLVVDKCNDQGGNTKPVLSKQACDFLKEWDPDFLEDITKVVSAEEIATAVSSKGKER